MWRRDRDHKQQPRASPAKRLTKEITSGTAMPKNTMPTQKTSATRPAINCLTDSPPVADWYDALIKYVKMSSGVHDQGDAAGRFNGHEIDRPIVQVDAHDQCQAVGDSADHKDHW